MAPLCFTAELQKDPDAEEHCIQNSEDPPCVKSQKCCCFFGFQKGLNRKMDGQKGLVAIPSPPPGGEREQHCLRLFPLFDTIFCKKKIAFP